MLWARKFGGTLLLALFITLFSSSLANIFPAKAEAAAGVNAQISFQGKVVKSDGTNIADGTYNVQFKIYQDGASTGGGSNVWTENRLVSAGNGVSVTSGTFQVNLGSITSLSSVDFNQNTLWLSLQVGNTTSCTITTNFQSNCGGDGEMSPFIRFTSTPYALNADKLDGLDSSALVQLNPSGQQTGSVDISGNVKTGGNLIGTNAAATNYLLGALGLGTTNPQTTAALTLANGKWISAVDASGTGYVNMFQLNGQNQIQVGAALNIDGGIVLPTNGGQMTLVDLGIDGTAAAGAKQSYSLRVGSTNALTVYGEADGAGNAQNLRVAVGSSITPQYTLDVGGDLNLSSGSAFRINGTAGAALSCSSGNVIQNATVMGGIVTAGSCAAVSAGGVTSVGTFSGSTSYANGASISGSTLTLGAADASNPGLVSTGSQTFAGAKTFNGGIAVAGGQSITLTGGITSTRPVSPTAGMLYFDQTTGQLLTYSGSKWQADRSSNTVVVGTSASGGTSSAVASKAPDGADYVNTSTTSAQTVINSALTAAAAAGGGSVYLMEGTYIIDGSINIPDRVTLLGAGVNATTIKLKNAINANINAITNANTSNAVNIRIAQLTVDGNKANNTSGTQTGIYGNNIGNSTAEGLNVDSLTVQNFRTHGLSLNSASRSMIKNSTLLSNNGNGIDVNLISASTITQNVIGSNSGTGIAVSLSTNLIISNNTITGNATQGVYLNFFASANMVTGNQITENGGSTDNNGVVIDGDSDNNSISGNVISDTSATTTNIAIKITNSAADSNRIADNTVTSSGTISDSGTGTIYAGQADASGVLLNRSSAGSIFQATTNGVSSFQIQNSGGASFFTADSSNQLITTKDLNVGDAANRSTGRLFSDGFESGNLDKWMGSVSGSVTAATDQKRGGRYAAKVVQTGAASAVSTTINSSATVALRGYVYASASPSANGSILFGTYNNNDGTGFVAASRSSAGLLCVYVSFAGTNNCSATALPLNQWNKVELIVTSATTASGSYSLYLNDTALLTASSVRTNSSLANFDRIQLGSGSGTTQTFWTDDMVVDTQLSGDSASLNVNDSLHVAGTSSFGSSVLIQPAGNTTQAFRIQNSTGATLFTADTINSRIGIGTTSTATARVDVKATTADSSASVLNLQDSNSGALLNVRNDGQLTVGSTSPATSTATFGSFDPAVVDTLNDNNLFLATKFTTGTSGGTLDSLSIYVGTLDPTVGNRKYRLGIYTEGGSNKPTTLIAQSAEGTLTTANGYNTLPVSATLSGNTSYWLVYWTNGTASNRNSFAYNTGAANQYYQYALTYSSGGLPPSASAAGSNYALALAINASMTVSTTTTPLIIQSNGNSIFQAKSSTTTAFQIQNTSGASLFTVDTQNTQIIANNITKFCIALASCTRTLGVGGSIGATGAINGAGSFSTTGGADVAEYIHAAPDVAIADVVMADQNDTERVVKTSSAYSTAAVGVIADPEKSGFISNIYADIDGNTSDPDAKPLTIAGRVQVKVTDEGGRVRPGDYLTSSSTPGKAMKATRAGPTIGKALGFFDETEGTVLVLVNLSYYDPFDGNNLQSQSGVFNALTASAANFSSLNISGPVAAGTLKVTGLATFDGSLVVAGPAEFQDITVNGRLLVGGAKPTVIAGKAIGTAKTSMPDTAPTVSMDGNDTAGTITVRTGGSAVSSGVLTQLRFSEVYRSPYKVVVSAANGPAGKLRVYTSKTAEGFELLTDDTIAQATEYQFDFITIGIK